MLLKDGAVMYGEAGMEKRGIFITQFDLDRLNVLIAEKRAAGGDHSYLNDLVEELRQAEIVDSHEVPADVITMNSRVRLEDAETGEQMVLSLVFPQDADIDEGRISILAPIGTGMIGLAGSSAVTAAFISAVIGVATARHHCTAASNNCQPSVVCFASCPANR